MRWPAVDGRPGDAAWGRSAGVVPVDGVQTTAGRRTAVLRILGECYASLHSIPTTAGRATVTFSPIQCLTTVPSPAIQSFEL